MGNGWSSKGRSPGGGGGGGGGGASCELYVDKAVKVLAGGLQMILGIALVVLSHVLEDVCGDLRTFSFLVLLQAVWVLLVLVLWFWCYGQDLCSHLQEILLHVDHLTLQYQRYTDGLIRGGVHRAVTEETLHSDLGSYLEYLQHVLMVKGGQVYRRHLLKWVTVLLGSFLWLVGMIVLTVLCGLPSPLFLKVLVLLPILILIGALVLVTFHLLYDLCLPRDYETTFFYLAVPGTMDVRLSRAVSETYNPRCVWLMSRHCWHNAPALCSNAGLATALARKYRYVSTHHRPHRWRDQHFPTLRSDQVEKFMFNSEQFALRDHRGDCCHSWLWCCLDSPPTSHLKTSTHVRRGRKKRNIRSLRKQKVGADNDHFADAEASSGYSSGFRPAVDIKAEDGYMTPNLFVRKLAKEAATPEQMLEEEICRRKKPPVTRRSPRDDLHVPSLGPQRFPATAKDLGLSRDDTEVDYGAFYQPHEADPHRMQREYDPLTYGVRMSVKKEMAKDMKVWK